MYISERKNPREQILLLSAGVFAHDQLQPPLSPRQSEAAVVRAACDAVSFPKIIVTMKNMA